MIYVKIGLIVLYVSKLSYLWGNYRRLIWSDNIAYFDLFATGKLNRLFRVLGEGFEITIILAE